MATAALKFASARSIALAKLAKDDLRTFLGGAGFACSSATLVNTGLSLPLRSSYYQLEAFIIANFNTLAGQPGFAFGWDGSAPTYFAQGITLTGNGSSTTQFSSSATALNTLMQDSASHATGANFYAFMHGFIASPSAGNITVQAARTAGVLSMLQQCWFRAVEI